MAFGLPGNRQCVYPQVVVLLPHPADEMLPGRDMLDNAARLFRLFAQRICSVPISKVGIQMGNQLSQSVAVRLPNARTHTAAIGSFSTSWL